jgi:dTDP-4-dehydrorhamnose reductase
VSKNYFTLLHCSTVPDEEICEVTARCTRPLDASRQNRSVFGHGIEPAAEQFRQRPNAGMKILVTGGHGQLGREILGLAGHAHEIVGVDRPEVDIADQEQIIALVSRSQPDVVVHAAANTDVDGCELNPNEGWRNNALATRNVAIACRKVDATLIYLSTDFVFDGKKGSPYDEFDVPHPINVYGRTKLAGEYYAAQIAPRFLIVRTAWLFGHHGHNFVEAILQQARKGDALHVVDDQVGSPTFAPHLAGKILKLAERNSVGICHITNSGICSWFEFANGILEAAGVEARLERISSSALQRPAARPSFSALNNLVLRLDGYELLPDWREALKEYFARAPVMSHA